MQNYQTFFFTIYANLSLAIIIYFAKRIHNLKKTQSHQWRLVIYSTTSSIIGTITFPFPYKRKGNVLFLSEKIMPLVITNTGTPKSFELINGEGVIVSRGIASTINTKSRFNDNVLMLQTNAPEKAKAPWVIQIANFSFEPCISSWDEIDHPENYGPDIDAQDTFGLD